MCRFCRLYTCVVSFINQHCCYVNMSTCVMSFIDLAVAMSIFNINLAVCIICQHCPNFTNNTLVLAIIKPLIIKFDNYIKLSVTVSLLAVPESLN